MNRIRNNQKGESGFFIISLIFALIILGGFIWFMFNIHQYIDDVDDGIKKEAQVEKEARHDGIATTALVVDKNIQHNSYRTGFNSYELTLYSLKETFHKQVSKKEFDAISTNTYIQVVVKDDRILLGNKEDEEETIRYLSSKE